MIRFRTLNLVILTLLLASCGGSGGDASGGGFPNPGTTGPITLMDDGARYTIIQNCLAAFKALGQTNAIVDSNKLLTAAQKISGLQNISLTPDGNVTGNFPDGVPFCFYNDRGLQAYKKVSRTLHPATGTFSEKVSSGSVQILDSLDPIFLKDRTNDDAGMFNRHGYPGTVITKSTVEALRSLGSLPKPMAVLEVAGHGGLAKTADKLKLTLGYGLWTATVGDFNKKSPTYNGRLYAPDLVDGSMGVGLALSGYDSQGDPIPTCHFLILPQFILKYHWKFAPRSYVALSVCSGMSTQAATFRQALYQLGASAVAGWTDSVYGGPCARYISYNYDRMLGANEFEPTNPGHRPFGIASILGDFYRTGADTLYGPHGLTSWDVKWNPAETGVDQQFSLLKPAIYQDQLNTNSNGASAVLSFSADFDVPGTGVPTLTFTGGGGNFVRQSSGLYTGTISSTASGNLFGTVRSVDGLSLNSNVRSITLFSGSVSAENKQVGTGSASGVITVNVSEPVHIQADVESQYRFPSEDTPSLPQPGAGQNGEKIYAYNQNLGEKVTISGGGSIVTKNYNNGVLQSTDQRTLSGGGTVTNIGPGGMAHTALSIPPDPTQPAYLSIQISSPLFLTQKDIITSADGKQSPPQTTPLGSGIQTGIFATDDYLPIGLTSSYTISGKSLDTGLVSLGGGPIKGEYTLKYSFATANPPPIGTAR